MLILLPPSESKATRSRGAALRPEALSFPELTGARAQVAAALATVSAREDAPEVLGVSERTVQRDWMRARAWLHAELYPESGTS